MKQLIVLLIIFLSGFLIGLTNFNVPLSNHWSLFHLTYYRDFSLEEIILKPVLLPPPQNIEVYRPMYMLFYKGIYSLSKTLEVDVTIIVRMFESILLGVFGTVSYLLLKKLNPAKFKQNIASAICCLLSFPVLSSVWFFSHDDIVVAIFLFLAFIFYADLRKDKNKFSWKKTITFVIIGIISVLLKENSVLFLFSFALLYNIFFSNGIDILKKWQFKKLVRQHSIELLSFFILIIFLLSLPTFKISYTEGYKLPFSPIHISYIVVHTISQLFFSISTAGIIILFLGTLSIFNTNLKRRISVISVLLLLFIFAMPIFITFSYFGIVFFDLNSFLIFTILGFIGLISLFIILKKADNIRRFYSGFILFITFFVIISILLLPSVREEISSRAFIPLLPFLFYLVVDSLLLLLKLGKNNRFLYVTIVLIIILFFYYLLASLISIQVNMSAYQITEYNTKSFLNKTDINDSTIFFNDASMPLNEIDFKFFNKWAKDTLFIFVNSNKISNDVKDIEKEICVKSTSHNYPLNEKMYFYILEKKSLMNNETNNILHGNFLWLENKETISLIQPAPKNADYWFWEQGMITFKQDVTYSRQTLLERFLKEKGASTIFQINMPIYEIPYVMENALMALKHNIPFLRKYDYTGKIYYLNATSLKCDNWYYEEQHENRSFRWMSQNATLVINNKDNIYLPAKLKFNTNSFYKSRILILYHDDKAIAVYPVNIAWLKNKIISPVLELHPGKNIIKFYSKEGCDIPKKLGVWDDHRCISFAVENISIEYLENSSDGYYFSENWYEDKVNDTTINHISKNGTIWFMSDGINPISLNFFVKPYFKPRTLEVYLNGIMTRSYFINETQKIILPLYNITPGKNTFLFNSKEGCDIPDIMENNSDTRCLSFTILDIRISANPLGYVDITDSSNNTWHLLETLGNQSWRWMSQNATITIFNPYNEEWEKKLDINLWSYYMNRTLETYLNGKLINSSLVPSNAVKDLIIGIKLVPGMNTISFHSQEGCSIPNMTEMSQDERCLSFAFTKIIPREIL